MTDDERKLRRSLWLGHGHTGIYGDDGEMQCVECGCDYKRDDGASIVQAVRAAARAEAVERPGLSRAEHDSIAARARAEALESAAAVVGFEAAHANVEFMENGDDWDKNMRDWLLRIEDRIRSLEHTQAELARPASGEDIAR